MAVIGVFLSMGASGVIALAVLANPVAVMPFAAAMLVIVFSRSQRSSSQSFDSATSAQ
jgi:hypothetical protein